MSKRLAGWFVKRRETIAIKMAKDHLAKAVDSITELNKAVKAASKGDSEEAELSIKRLFACESEADRIRREIAEELTKGELPSKDREDLMHLVRRMDAIADWARDASRSLKILLDVKIPDGLWSKFTTISSSLVECVWALRKSVGELDKDLEEASKLSFEVDRIEHRIDEEYFEARRAFIDYAKEIETPIFIILRDLLHDLEQVADSCEDTADLIRIMTIRMR